MAAEGGWRATDERPLPARSVIASTLLGVHPPRLPTALLVQSCGLFGIADGTARVAMSRMVSAGELVAEDGRYALSGSLLARQSRQDESRAARTRRWSVDDGLWRTAIVSAEARPPAARARLRGAARAARLGELREGVWMRPDNLIRTNDDPSEAELAAQCLLLGARPDTDPAALAGRLWDLGRWAARARHLHAALETSRPALDAGDRGALPDGFVLSAAVLRHLQADPLLPDELLPEGWPGPALRDAHRGWDAAFGAVWADWYRSARTA